MDNKYQGMTVIERLYVSGLINQYDTAVNQKNKVEIIRILKELEITDETSINDILATLNL
jgi:hypothetical protein